MIRRGAILLLLVVSSAAAQERTPLNLERANSFTATEVNGVRRQELKGDVRMSKDTLRVDCQEAVYYPDSGIVIFRINVVFKDPSRILFADEVRYNEFTEEADATSRVRVYQHDTLSVTCDRARYFDRMREGYLYGNVRIRQESKRVMLAGREGFVDHDRNFGRVTGDPVLTERDSSMNLITEVHGDTVEYYGDEKRVRVENHVRIDRDSLTATGATLDYFTGLRTAVLTGLPHAVRGPDQASGDTIRLFFEKNEKLSRVEVSGHALATSPADSGQAEPRNRMEGKTITLYVADGLVQQVDVEGTATATYFVRDQEKKRGLNVTSGDRLHVFFENRKISRIRVEGGTEGTYTPQRLVQSVSDTSEKR
jgi:lipopolysaccharide export system protein LptA